MPQLEASQEPKSSRTTAVTRYGREGVIRTDDALAVEAPLEIRLGVGEGVHFAFCITMRTPGEDPWLAAGFLYAEGIIHNAEQVELIEPFGPADPRTGVANTLKVMLSEDCAGRVREKRRALVTHSSCGVCGKPSIESLSAVYPEVASPALELSTTVLTGLPELFRRRQHCFAITGGLHAAALCDSGGCILQLHEDVGRHNALDKCIGRAVMAGELPLNRLLLLLSGRASYELIQKAAMAGIQFVASIGPPSTLALDLAMDCGMTLVGFLKPSGFNLYHLAEGHRIFPG